MKLNDNHKENLYRGKERLAVWGVGYIGFSNMLYYGKEAVHTVGIDVNPNIYKDIMGKEKLRNFEYWVGFDYSYLLEQNIIELTCDYNLIDYSSIAAHLICVPTEKNEQPYNEALYDVIDKICDKESKVNGKDYFAILIESTMIPGTAKQIEEYILKKEINKKFVFGVAPRRDWFLSSDKNLKNLHRVYGGNSEKSSLFWKDVLSIVCDNLVQASDYQHSEITKSIENAFRHMDITLANQLSSAFPNLDMREVLHLAATKWNVNEYFPSFGTGGYCIPLSSKYLLSTENSDVLTLLRDTVTFDENRPHEICKLIEKYNVKRVGILGVSYKEDIKVDKHSAVVSMIEYFDKHNIDVKIHDPYYSKDELKEKYGAEYFDCYDLLNYDDFEAIIMFTAHKEYQLICFNELKQHIKKCKLILDNTAKWATYEKELPKQTKYSLVGSKGWKTI